MSRSGGSLRTLRELKGKAKLRYILDYYKLPLILAGLLLYAAVWFAMRSLNQKENILFVGLINAVPSEEMMTALSDGYLDAMEYPESDFAVYLYRNLFLTADEASEYHAYSYASRMKILGAIDAQRLDIVLMNQEAFDAFSQNGYLEDLAGLIPGASGQYRELYDRIADSLQKNIYIREDNATDILLGTADEYWSVSSEGFFGLDLSAVSPLIQKEELTGNVYLGIIANSPRKEEALRYLEYLT